ncbi:D-aminoacyl-tRNA deacylase [Eucalyptus grandis]|uniref:D-aminoacyl-tRNA deacylase n=1 Tax=Eucalyptus grandis TaxID=71139 RepID=UPI00192EADBB|nr:D-aminoacyl-tRNA deacylase [Eucalyptus grandis]
MWVAPPHPRVRRENPWLGLLHDIAQSYNLVPEFEITLEGINHRPETNNKLATFVTIGSTEEYWMRLDAAEVIAQLGWKGLGLGGEPAVGNWSRYTLVLQLMLQEISLSLAISFRGCLYDFVTEFNTL